MNTFTERIAAYFRQQPEVWIPAVDLERVGGRQAWRTRLSEARRHYGMTIENRIRWVPPRVGRAGDQVPGFRLSEYRYVPR